jgi:hypothetical protein
MLNNFLTRLNGSSADPATLLAAIDDIGRNRAATQAQIAELVAKRHQGLHDDLDDDALAKISLQIERAKVRLEKLDLAEPALREKLAAATAEALRKATDKHFDIIATRYEALRAAVLKAEAEQIALMAARDDAVSEVGEHAVTRTIPVFAFGGLLGAGLAKLWADENDRVLLAAHAARTGYRPAKKAQVKPAMPSITVAPKRAAPARPAVTKAEALGDELVTAIGPDQVQARVLRAGYPDASGQQCQRGRVINLAREVAEAAAKAGAIEIIELSPAPTPATGASDSIKEITP